MKYLLSIFFLHTFYAISQFPELYFGHLKDKTLAAQSFTQKIPDHVRLVEENGDSTLNYTIISGIIELLETGEKGQIKTGGYLSEEAIFMMSNAGPGIIKISVYCKSVDMLTSFESSMHFALGVSPRTQFAGITNADTLVTQKMLYSVTQIKMGYPAYGGMEDFFQIKGGTLQLEGSQEVGKILPDGFLDEQAIFLLQNAAGYKVTLYFVWTDGSGVARINNFWFKVISD